MRNSEKVMSFLGQKYVIGTILLLLGLLITSPNAMPEFVALVLLGYLVARLMP